MFTTKLSSELRRGDVVVTDDIRVLLDVEPRVSSMHPATYGPVYVSRGKVLNFDAIRAKDPWLAGLILDRHHPVPSTPEDPRWTIQGNDNARWAVEVPADQAVA